MHRRRRIETQGANGEAGRRRPGATGRGVCELPGALACALVLACVASAQETSEPAQASSGSDAELAQQLANPVSSLISVPFQLNYDCCTGPNDDGRYLLNIQPVVPIHLTENWNLIIRTILPIVHQEGLDDRTGLGDTVQSFFFSPPAKDGLTWAVGPALLYPTGTEGFSGRQWGAGPTGLVLKQQGGATYGVLANHIWSLAGDENRPDVSSTFVQPFFNYTTPGATSFVIQSETTYDWEREEWTVPINAGVAQMLAPGGQRLQLGVFGRAYLDAPGGEPDWGMRLVATLLFPA